MATLNKSQSLSAFYTEFSCKDCIDQQFYADELEEEKLMQYDEKKDYDKR